MTTATSTNELVEASEVLYETFYPDTDLPSTRDVFDMLCASGEWSGLAAWVEAKKVSSLIRRFEQDLRKRMYADIGQTGV